MDQTESNTAERIVEIRKADGLHLRPAKDFVERAGTFESCIQVHKKDMVVDGKSIMEMAMLNATKGTRLRITAQGVDADEAVATLADILEAADEPTD